MTEPNVTQQRVGELQCGVFTILLDQPEGLPAKEQTGPPAEFEKSDYPTILESNGSEK